MTEITENNGVMEVCNQLLKEVGCDFVALALQNEVGPDVRWHYASGNVNDKYKRITVRFGKGIAGKIISSGSPMMLSDFPNDIYGKVTDHPIMLAEKLISCYAVPLFFNGSPKGVLLVGKRVSYTFSEDEQEQVKESAESVEQLLGSQILGGGA
ncbi:GAF domain-containing protein [Bacillus sp. EB106-08-02-XG196]|jgi:nitrogen regulatory protein A|uniref:GAF domain-containing protein n=1 Tax=Bacillus sp. EB106-08-02-XG196 TaxID=2737049 RepID=UPI0015C42E8B|nr:GAF domain-containing protein [Bacillus sp. EB106-08-02-XG196]NWQ40616.1 GAF domain-containing protein [Bacillus sp. EB106-08-02-XG196]